MRYYDNCDEFDEAPEDFRAYFADPGGRSSLRAGNRCNPCPTCGAENVLTNQDVRLGYQCDDCADAQEGGW